MVTMLLVLIVRTLQKWVDWLGYVNDRMTNDVIMREKIMVFTILILMSLPFFVQPIKMALGHW